MKDNILPRIFVLGLVILTVIAGMAIHALQTINRSVASSDWVNQTYATIYEFENIASGLRQADGLMRTYALTGEDRDLAAARDGFARLGERFDTAKALTRDDTPAHDALLRLETLVQERETLLQQIGPARALSQADKVRTLLAADAGLDAVAAIERGFGTLRDAQYEKLSERERVSYRQAQTTRWVVSLGIGLNFLLLAGIGWLLRDDIAARRRAAAALTTANAQLEDKVRARTAELAATNAQLSAENLERKWTITSQEHQLRYNQLIVNSVNDLVFVLTKALTITRINAAVVHLTGRVDETIITRPLAEIVEVAPDPVTGLDPLARALREGRDLRQQAAVVLGPGALRRPARLTLIPLRDQDKVVGGVIIVQVAFSTAADQPLSS